ncbi:MAG: hypothetical protein OXF65_00310, partial [Acidimicrobiaceae bacterium]|nr:hypothetical protein [Acidimicrobiaceae bacterium]
PLQADPQPALIPKKAEGPFNNANISGAEMAIRLDRHLNRILRRAAKPGPFVYVIGKEGLQRRWPRN